MPPAEFIEVKSTSFDINSNLRRNRIPSGKIQKGRVPEGKRIFYREKDPQQVSPLLFRGSLALTFLYCASAKFNLVLVLMADPSCFLGLPAKSGPASALHVRCIQISALPIKLPL